MDRCASWSCHVESRVRGGAEARRGTKDGEGGGVTETPKSEARAFGMVPKRLDKTVRNGLNGRKELNGLEETYKKLAKLVGKRLEIAG